MFDSISTNSNSNTDLHFTPEETLLLACIKILTYQFNLVQGDDQTILEGADVEAIHSMRVATRRMRVCFDLLGLFYSSLSVDPIIKDLKKTGRALGKVRDLDILIEKTELYQQNLRGSNQNDISNSINLWRDQRTSKRIHLAEFLTSKRYFDFVKLFDNFITSIKTSPTTFLDRNTKTTLSFTVPHMILTVFDEIWDYDKLISKATFTQLHSLRIKFKYLRYTLEFFQSVLHPETLWVIDKIKNIQDHLGDLNDSHFALKKLQQLNPELGESITLMDYFGFREHERDHLYMSFISNWQNFNNESFFQKSKKLLSHTYLH